ncbi:aldehyde dehydrogenase family protein [Acidobacteriota bacterium]
MLVSINPADQSVVGEVPIATQQDVNQVVAKAKEQYKKWKEYRVRDRIPYVEKFAQELKNRKDGLARLISQEMGKPFQEAANEIQFGLNFLQYYIQESQKILEDEILAKSSLGLNRVVHESIGVCGVITPWNFPTLMSIWGIMPNIIAGNTVVYKPSENTPLVGQEIVDALESTGLPDGVINIIQGDGRVGSFLVDSPVDLFWFTGSTKVGQEIFEKCSRKFIRCLLELGGSSPAIVCDDADIDQAIGNIYFYRFFNCGQVCDAVKRLFVSKEIFEEFVEKLSDKVRNAVVGNPLGDVNFGPLVSQKQLTLLEEQVQDAVEKGARAEVGGTRPSDDSLQKGFYYCPTVLTNVDFTMRVLNEEVFGPVLPVMPYSHIDEAIEMANRTEYGLSAQIYTKNMDLGRMIAGKIDAGTVAINTNDYISPAFPFGGYKKSGMGREGGKTGFHELTQLKHICERKG